MHSWISGWYAILIDFRCPENDCIVIESKLLAGKRPLGRKFDYILYSKSDKCHWISAFSYLARGRMLSDAFTCWVTYFHPNSRWKVIPVAMAQQYTCGSIQVSLVEQRRLGLSRLVIPFLIEAIVMLISSGWVPVVHTPLLCWLLPLNSSVSRLLIWQWSRSQIE